MRSRWADRSVTGLERGPSNCRFEVVEFVRAAHGSRRRHSTVSTSDGLGAVSSRSRPGEPLEQSPFSATAPSRHQCAGSGYRRRVVNSAQEVTRRLTVRLPIDLVEKVYDAAELSRRTVTQFVEAVLAREISRWDAQLPPLPAPPPDFQRALDAHPGAAEFFATVSRRNHYAILKMIEGAKRPATRARRIDKAIGMLSRGETPYRF